MKVRAKFTGADGEFRNSHVYVLDLQPCNGGLTIDYINRPGKCFYESWVSFFNNWDEIARGNEVSPAQGCSCGDSGCKGHSPVENSSRCRHCDDLDRQFAHLKAANTGAWQYRNEHGHWVTCETQTRPISGGASTGEQPPVLHTPFQKPLTVVMLRDKSDIQAEKDVAAIADGSSTIIRIGVPELYFHHLRLRVTQSPELAEKIAVFYVMPSNEMREVELKSGQQIRWPVGFGDQIWNKEKEIEKVRMAARPSGPYAPKVRVTDEIAMPQASGDIWLKGATETASAHFSDWMRTNYTRDYFRMLETIGKENFDNLDKLISSYAAAPSGTQPTTCKARAAGTAGGNYPQDCDWPFCGCDERAEKVMETLLESGWLGNKEASDLRRELAVEKELSARLAAKEVDQAIRAESAESKLAAIISGAAQGTVEDIAEAITKLILTDEEWTKPKIEAIIRKHLLGAPAREKTDEK